MTAARSKQATIGSMLVRRTAARHVARAAVLAAATAAAGAHASLVGICGDSFVATIGGQSYHVVDVYASFDSDTSFVVAMDAFSASLSDGSAFHHLDASGTGSWSPAATPEGPTAAADSFVTIGDVVGPANDWTAPTDGWGPLGFGQPGLPPMVGWSNGNETNGAGQAVLLPGTTCGDGFLVRIARFSVVNPAAVTLLELSGTVRWTEGFLGRKSSQPFESVFVVYAGPPLCPADLDRNGVVDGADLGELLGAWGPCSFCAADLDGDQDVDGADLGALLAAWGPCGR